MLVLDGVLDLAPSTLDAQKALDIVSVVHDVVLNPLGVGIWDRSFPVSHCLS